MFAYRHAACTEFAKPSYFHLIQSNKDETFTNTTYKQSFITRGLSVSLLLDHMLHIRRVVRIEWLKSLARVE